MTYGGGVFSKVILQFQNIEKNVSLHFGLNHLDTIYLQNLDARVDLNINPYDFVFQQEYDPKAAILAHQSHPTYRCDIPQATLNRFKIIRKKLKLHPEVLEKYERCLAKLPFTDKTIGVHVRLTDMNTQHGNDYGFKHFSDYERCITNIVKENPDQKVFVAVDNLESLDKLRRLFGDSIMYCDDLFRPKSENGGTEFQLDNFSTKALWQDSFVEMLLLAKCNKIYCRVSNVVNVAIIYADNLNQTILI